MGENNWRNKIFNGALCLVAFVMSFPFNIEAVAIWTLIAAWLVQGDLKNKVKELSKPGYLLWILYFFLFALSISYSENKNEGIKDVVLKLSFIVFPVVIGTGIFLNKKTLENLFFWFIAGLTLTAAFCIGRACWLYYLSHDETYFFYHILVDALDSNAVYMSFYVFLSLFLLLFFEWQMFFNGKNRKWKWILTILLFAFFLLLSCRLLIVLFFILLLILSAKSIKGDGPSIQVRKILIGTIVLGSLCVLVFTNNPIKERYENLRTNNINFIFEKGYAGKDFKVDHLTFRPLIWRVCLQNVVEKKLWLKGCGSGDVSDIQNKEFEELGVPGFKESDGFQSPFHDIAIHNMYLQTLIMIGIPGLVCLLTIVLLPFFYLKNLENNLIFLVFFISAIMFMCQESVLQTQGGLVYYTFFSVIFWNYYYSNKIAKECNASKLILVK